MRLGGEIPVSERLLARIKEQAAHGNVMNDYTRIVREALNNKFDHDRPWKQY